jgi:hypothetical protein
MNKLKVFTDQPIGEGDIEKADGLGFKTYAKILGDAAMGTNGPFTIGVFGEWGTGKTSLMRLIREYLEKEHNNNVITVWLNAWRFEKEEHPVVPLIASILFQLERQKNRLQKLKDKGEALIKALRALVYGFSTKFTLKVPGLAELETSLSPKDMIDRSEKLSENLLADKSLYYQAFEALSDVKLGKEVKIVVLIDDLDRCFPDSAINLLDSIKLVLAQPGFIFVLGMARSVIEGFLKNRYREQYGIEKFEGQAYLDKMVQLPFYIPSHAGRMEEFSKSLLEQMDKKDQAVFKEILPIMGIACSNNPRATIRLVNNLLIDREINRALAQKEQIEEIPIGYFAVTRSLQQHWLDMFALLFSSDEICTAVSQWLPDDLETHAQSDRKDEADAAALLLADRNLKALLFSSHGLAWLKDHKLRKEATSFLRAQRPESTGQASYGEIQSDVYLCSQVEDIEDMSRVVNILGTKGIPMFFNLWGRLKWGEELKEVILNSKVVVLFIGPSFGKKEKISKEMEFVLSKAGEDTPFRLLPVLLPKADINSLPEILKSMQIFDLSKAAIDEESLAPLIRVLFLSIGERDTPFPLYQHVRLS